ncbi:MAG TPA: hypothetical protein VK590_11340, partial [Saprospiraceae bacterium]|nr:hypothetical protein [Saprospiraceae bacterium]
PPYDHTDINIKEIIINNTSKTFVDSDKSTTEIKEYQDDELFMAFYIQYPNKQKPTAAYKAFKKLNPDEKFVTMLILDLMSRKANNWKGRHKSKIPHPATYLNGKEWEGEIYSQETNTQISNKPPRYTVSELYSTVKFTDEIL